MPWRLYSALPSRREAYGVIRAEPVRECEGRVIPAAEAAGEQTRRKG